MAYKYQSLAATMSGSLTQEGDFTVKNDAGVTGFAASAAGVVSGSGTLSAGGALRTAGTVRFDGVADAALAVASDSFYFLDGDGLMKRDTMADYATAIAGDGLAASSGVLAVGVDDSTIETSGDALRLKDDGVTGAKLAPAVAGYGLAQDGSGNLDMDLSELTAETIASGDFLAFQDVTDDGTHKETVDDLATLFAGSGLAASSAVLSVAVSGAVKIASDKVGISGSFAGAGIGFLGGVDSISGIELDLNELAAAAVDVGNDSIAIIDANDSNVSKKESIADLATGMAGDGLAASSGVLSVSLTELTEAAVNVAADSLIFIDADGNVTRRDTFADYATALAGNALVASSGVLALQTSGSALKIASDKLGISGSIAGDCLDKGPGDGVDSIRTLHVVADESTIESVGRASLRIKDDGVTGAKLAPAVAGAGLAQDGSGNLDIGAATNGGITVNANDIGLNINDLSAAAVDVAADSIAIVDANDSNASRKESIADLMTAAAGAGLTATNGVLSVTGNNVALKADGNALVEGYNYFADASSNATVTMPASPSVGDVVVAKAGNLTSNAVITINKGSADHRIDGLEGIVLESPFASVTMVYVVADAWRIV